MAAKLLSREEFRTAVLARHGGRCCVPHDPEEGFAAAVDAHHILNRNLFAGDDERGGYFLDNGANLCTGHHVAAERSLISVEQLREWCGITSPVLPAHLAADTGYDTWGNPVLPDGTRLPGELFYTDGCQKALRPVLGLFQQYVKYPRTLHLAWSPGLSGDDKVQRDLSALEAADEVVVTLKIDGESTTIYPDGHSHARSVSSGPHWSRDHVRALAARVAHELPSGWRLVGENARAVHSIAYDDLPAHFLLISIWDRDRCLSWAETQEWAQLLDLVTVQVIYRGPMPSVQELEALFAPYAAAHEGYVIRDAADFSLAEFRRRVCKWVRAGHVQTSDHWTHREARTNGLAEPSRKPTSP